MPALRLTQLNYDVLYSILYRLDTPALYATNLVSKELHRLSFPHLYRDVRLVRDPQQILALCRSVLAATGSRVGYAIRRLEIDKEAFHTGPSVIWMGPSGLPALCPPEYHLFASTLADAIQKMPNLRAISIGAWVEDLFFFEPRVARAITSRPRLAKIKLCGLRNGASDLLQALRHLRAINVPYPLGSITADSGIGKVILDSQHTLEELAVPMLSDPRDVLGSSATTKEDELPIWPRVHTLVIANSTVMDPTTLSRAFPSTVHFSGTGVFSDTVVSGEALPIWPLLKSVEGDYSLVRVLASGRKGLRRIFLRARSEEDFVTKERAEEFLGFVRGPSVRSLRLTVWADMPRSFFENLFRSVPQLAFLEIEVAEDLANSRGSALLKVFEIASCLPKLHLSYVSFVIRPQITPTGPITVQLPEDSEHSRHALLRLIYKTCPTIRAMQLEARGLRWPTTWWKAIDAPCISEGILTGMREEEGMEERRWYDWHA